MRINSVSNKYIKAAIIVLTISLILEVFVWNHYFWTAMLYPEREVIDIDSVMIGEGLAEWDSDYTSQEIRKTAGREHRSTESSTYIVEDKEDIFFEIEDISLPVKSVYLGIDVYNSRADYEEGTALEKSVFKISYTDEGNVNYRDFPDFHVSGFAKQSFYFHPVTYGDMQSFKVSGYWEEGNVIDFYHIELNGRYPFLFSLKRLLILCAVVFGIYAFCTPWGKRLLCGNFRYGAANYRYFEICALILYIVFIAGFYFKGGFELNLDESDVWKTDNEYNMLTDALSKGMVFLDKEPPSVLESLDNPYDMKARNAVLKKTGEKYLWDTGYYKGKYFVYFGVVPSVLLYLPYFKLTGEHLSSAAVILLFIVLNVLALWGLIRAIFRRWFSHLSYKTYFLALMAGQGAICPLMFLARPAVYEVAVISALFFEIIGLYFWISAVSDKGLSYRRIIAGSFLASFSVGCRPSVMFFMFLAPFLFWETIKEHSVIKTISALIVPMGPVALGLMYYNKARFGSILDFGANYNLTVGSMPHRGVHIERLRTALFEYLFRTVSLREIFPYISLQSITSDFMGDIHYESSPGGVLFFTPIFLLLVVVFQRRFLKNLSFRTSRSRVLSNMVRFCILMALFIMFLEINVAGIVTRYRMDFIIILLIALVFSMCDIESRLISESALYYYHSLAFVLAFLTVAFSILYFYLGASTQVLEKYPLLFYEAKHLMEFWH